MNKRQKVITIITVLMLFTFNGFNDALATVFDVDRTDDASPIPQTCAAATPNDCSLRGAVLAANADVNTPHEIYVPCGLK